MALVGAAAVPLVLAGVQTAGAQTAGAQLAGASPASASWTLTDPVIPTGATQSYFSHVACPSRNNCFAIGTADSANSTLPLAEHWNGTAWAAQDMPLPAGNSNGQVQGLACPTARDCIAVGSYGTNFNVQSTLAERWTGTSWVVLKTPTLSGSSTAGLGLVSCASATSCLALGSVGTDGTPLAETYNGKAWTVLTSAPSGGQFEALSCPSATSCVAVGINGKGLFAASWDGSTWTTQSTPSPKGATQAAFSAIWCGSATDCIATGEDKHGRPYLPLAESWNGTAWTPMLMERLSGLYSSDLSGLSCNADGSNCTAVGYQVPFIRPRLSSTLAEHWTGTRWGEETTADPSGVRDSSLNSVSCYPATNCTAVGNYTTLKKKNVVMAEQGS
ncbi:MAG TPA: hypothetical protein VGH27_31415 [Streptosporangiaceae bacterium]